MKQLAIALVLGLALLPLAEATPGRLNSCGCHHSKKAGYHCHKNLCPKPTMTAPKKGR